MSAFDSKNRTFRHRNEIEVFMRLKGSDDGAPVTIFASNGERPQDILNDDRTFIPIRRQSGETILIAKSQIEALTERTSKLEDEADNEALEEEFNQESIKEAISKKSFDPYALLRIAPGASPEEIRAAYKARIKAVHPDTLAALGLDEDITKAAILATQKVNYAYQKIMRERGSTTERVV
ncbi:J domain-containing protein [Hyphococcus flavus]|uniref:J domain-containing protein n=1 Tax=Hyphococcus flavus TaxID=1866326 RepID=A0AAE9ZBB9_9PROT|nr:J domain-containing protein [Hyphococcus flavus]WDI30886.1 J domain-containing protein [Hyphococcus flavus]